MAPTRCATGSAVLFLGTVAVLLAAQSAVAAKFDWTNAQYIDALKSIDFQPYTLERHQQTPYNPRTKPWDKVIAAFYTMLSYERRYAAFLIRGIFHDCLAVNTTTCTNPRKPGPGCRGCEGSMMLQDEELGRIENRIKKWGARLSKPLRIICKAFDISMADALAVGAAVAPTFLTHGRVQIVGKGLKVGRLDYLETAPARNLPPPGITTEQFIDFWQKADFSVKEGVALLGSHALLDNNFCQRGLRDFDVCNPEIECCADIKGMRWENHYYHDMCSGGLIITPVNPPVPVYPPKNVTLMTDEEFRAIVKTETCGFTSSDFKDSVRNLMGLVRAGSRQMEEFPASTLINWSQNGCTRSRRYGVRRDECPHPSNWPYTLNDAFNGQVCAEDNDRRKEGRDVKEIRRALREYLDQDEWDRDYTRAYIKMTEAWAHMPNAWTLPSIDPPVGTPSNPDFGLPVKLAEQLKSLEAADA